MKIILVERWGQYPPGTELNLHDELGETLVAARIARKCEPPASEAESAEAMRRRIETAEAPPLAETAARTAKPGRRRKPEATT